MTGVTLGGKTLTCTQITEGFSLIPSTQWQGWSGGTAGLRMYVAGLVRNWALKCTESNVNYPGSSTNSLRNSASAGSALSLVIDYGNMYYASATVKIDGIDVSLDPLGTQNIRHLTIRIHETI
jgi:hypothetical protein